MPKITKDHNSWSFFKTYSKVNHVVYPSLPIYFSSFKALALIVCEIFCWQDSIYIFQRAVTQKRGKILWRKKIRASFLFFFFLFVFFMRNSYKKFQNGSMHVSKVMLCIIKRDERTNRRTDGRTDGRTNQKQYAPPTSPNWGHKKDFLFLEPPLMWRNRNFSCLLFKNWYLSVVIENEVKFTDLFILNLTVRNN